MLKNKKIFFLLPLLLILIISGASCVKAKDGGVYKSEDQAENWAQKVFMSKVKRKTVTMADYEISCLKVDPLDSNIIYAGTKEKGLMMTKDAGETWTVTGLTSGNVLSVDIDPANNQTIYIAKDTSVLRSSDQGINWETVHTDSQKGNINKVLIDSYDSKRIYAASASGILYKSTDQGNNWFIKFQTEDTDEPIIDFYLRKNDTRIIYLLLDNGDVQKSISGGEQGDWATIFTKEHKEKWPDAKGAKNFFIFDNDPNGMYMTAEQGLLKSADEGLNWTQINTLIPAVNDDNKKIINLSIDPQNNNILYFTISGSNKIHKSTDSGKEWHIIENFPSTRLITDLIIDPKNSNILYAGTQMPAKKKGLIQ
jgi:photosystem II stability/assembly factor-like uncharacterized protein